MSTESRGENTLFDQKAKENYEAEVQVALASIQDAEKSKEKEDEAENVAADVDYYSISINKFSVDNRKCVRFQNVITRYKIV